MPDSLPSTLASDIISYVRSRCRLGSNPPNATFQTTQMLVALHDINEWFFYWPMSNGGMAPWKFTRKQKLYTPVDHTTLASIAAEGATSLVLTDGSEFESPASDSAGGFLKNTDGSFAFFTYESRSSNTLGTVTPLDIEFAAGTEVYAIPKLPADYGRPRALIINRTPYNFVDSEFDDVPPSGCYSTKYLESTNDYNGFYLVLPLLIGSGVTATLRYIKKPTTINDASSKIDAPNGIARWAVLKKFEAFVWFHRGEMELYASAEAEAERLIGAFADTQTGEDASPNQDPYFDLD